MNETKPQPPADQQLSLQEFLRFVWMFFMQPMSLHDDLVQAGIEDPDARLLTLFYAKDNRRIKRHYLTYLLTLLFVLTPLTAVISGSLFQLVELSVDWVSLTVGVAVGVAIGVILGLAGGVAFGIAFGVTFGVTYGLVGGAAVGVALGVAPGVAYGVTGGTTYKEAYNMAAIMVAGTAAGRVTVLAFIVAYVFSFLRLWFYPLESLWLFCLNICKRSDQVLRYAPVFYHELSYLPLPFLARMIEQTAATDPVLARAALLQCAKIPGQRAIGRRVVKRLQWREIKRLFEQHQFDALYQLNGEWLPGRSHETEAVLSGLSDIGHYLQAAQVSLTVTQKAQHLHRADELISALENTLLQNKTDWQEIIGIDLNHWQQWLEQQQNTLKRQA